MICSMMKRGWVADTTDRDDKQYQESLLGMRPRSPYRTGRTMPWYLKLLCEERTTETRSKETRSKETRRDSNRMSDMSEGPQANRAESIPQVTYGIVTKTVADQHGASVVQPPYTIEHMLSTKRHKVSKKSGHHRIHHPPYHADRDGTKKYRHDPS